MLKSVRVQNFRCFESLTVKMAPLTVLVGANDSGKTSFLRALAYLGEMWSWNEWDYHRGNRGDPILLEGMTDSGAIKLVFDTKSGLQQIQKEGVNRIMPVGFYQLPPVGVPMSSPGTAEGQAPPQLTDSGGNLPAFLDYLLRTDRPRFDEVEQSMRELIPGFERIEISTPTPAERRFDFTIDGGFKIIGDRSSAGVRLLLFFLALSYHPSPPRLILVEEPETGIHPKRLADVIRLLREITEGKHGGHRAQIVLTTHSPYLLDLVDLKTDQVLVFKRGKGGKRLAEPVDAERLRMFLDEFMLGEVWYNEGESGLIGQATS